jgi:hypothetical protein
LNHRDQSRRYQIGHPPGGFGLQGLCSGQELRIGKVSGLKHSTGLYAIIHTWQRIVEVNRELCRITGQVPEFCKAPSAAWHDLI